MRRKKEEHSVPKKKKNVAVCSGFSWLKICSNGSNDHSGSKYMHNFLISSATISLSSKILFRAVITAPKDHVTSPRDTGFLYLSFGCCKDVDTFRSLRRLTVWRRNYICNFGTSCI